jgi:hypothetical protein
MKNQAKSRVIIFWVATGLIIVSQAVSGVMDWAGAAPIVEGMTRLGFPLYVLKILGTWKILGAIALAIPGLNTAREWAYAGFFFDFTGALASHAFNGDSPGELVPPLILLAILIVSYIMRPEARRLG